MSEKLPFFSPDLVTLPVHMFIRPKNDCVLLFALLVVAPTTGCLSLPRKDDSQVLATSRQLAIRGNEANRRGRVEEAATCFENALEICPHDERAHAGYAQTLWDKGQQDIAVKHMTRAVQLSGGESQYRIRLGQMFLAMGELEDAAVQANAAVQQNRLMSEGWALRGDVAKQQGEFQQALLHYQQGLACQPHFPRIEMEVARLYQQLGKHHRMLATLDRLASRYSPGSQPIELIALQGEAFKALQRYPDAIQYFMAARQRAPQDVAILRQLSDSQRLSGDLANARITAGQALQLAPDDPQSLQLIASLQSPQATPHQIRTAARPR